MKFRYYITDTSSGELKGSNTKETAESYAESEDYFVVDTLTGQWLLPGGGTTDVNEIEDLEE